MIDTADIVDPSAAAVFENPRQRKIVLALIEKERCLTELAALTDTPLNLLHHHMARFMRLGLVSITRRQPRAGAPIKFYRATAQAFFVPAELAGADPRGPMFRRLRSALDRSLAGTLKGALYTHDGAGPRMRLVRHEGSRGASAETWLELRLGEADAQALTDEFRVLLKRFERKSGEAGQRYIVHAAIALS